MEIEAYFLSVPASVADVKVNARRNKEKKGAGVSEMLHWVNGIRSWQEGTAPLLHATTMNVFTAQARRRSANTHIEDKDNVSNFVRKCQTANQCKVKELRC